MTNDETNLKVNLGCGFNQLEGYVNIDNWDGCNPDIVCDLEHEVWPLNNDSVKEVLFDHSLEHMGATTESFFHVLKELYRVCMAGAIIYINVPHPKSDYYLNDPTHVRPILPETMGMFDLEINKRQLANNSKHSKLAMQCEVDFHIESVTMIPNPRVMHYNSDTIEKLLIAENNVADEINMVLKVVKQFNKLELEGNNNG